MTWQFTAKWLPSTVYLSLESRVRFRGQYTQFSFLIVDSLNCTTFAVPHRSHPGGHDLIGILSPEFSPEFSLAGVISTATIRQVAVGHELHRPAEPDS